MNQPQQGTQPELKQSQVGPAYAPQRPSVTPDGRTEAVAAPRVDDDWRRWIAENVMLEGTRESIVNAMVAGGISPQEATRELDLAIQSPYLKGAEILRNRLKKRDWLLATYRKINRMHAASGEVERRHKLSRK